MTKQYYDHRTKLCPACAYHRSAGERVPGNASTYYPEGCACYGYSFHPDRYAEDADDCPGYENKATYERRMQELSKRETNKTKK